ncbi:MAG: hypothetical protein H8D80_02440 [Proteobacteria bacterium]|nr:hypothetical protein [Pseudomonadota bacterium]
MALTVTQGGTGENQGNVITDTATGVTYSGAIEYNISGQAGLEFNAQSRQPKTTNSLLPTSYKFVLGRAPHLTFFCQSLSLPTISIDSIVQDSPFSDIHVPGGKASFENLTLNFIVDEKMANWLEIYHWMTSLTPTDQLSIRDENNKTGIVRPSDRFSDLSVVVTTNQSNGQIIINFKNAFPISLGEIEFSSTDTTSDPVTSNVSFQYDTYSVTTLTGY